MSSAAPPLSREMFDHLQCLCTTAKMGGQSIRAIAAEGEGVFEIFHQICSVSQFSHVTDYNDIHEDAMNALSLQINDDMRNNRLTPVVLLRRFRGVPSGTIANVANSEAEWLARCGAARVATDAEIAEAQANSTPKEPPTKSWSRSREIQNACRGVRKRASTK